MELRGAVLVLTLSVGALALPARRPPSFHDEPAAQAALSYEGARETAVALRLWESLLERYPGNTELWLRIARARLRALGREATVDLAQRFRALPEAQRVVAPDVEAGFRALSEIFLTDEGQTLFFEGQKRARSSECADAVLLFQRAAKLEGPHRKILSEKARCERELRAFVPYYETLRELDRTSYLDVALAEDLAEAHLFHQAPKPALDVVSRVPRPRRTARLELAAAMAELDLGEPARAGDWLKQAFDRARGERVDPLVYFGLGIVAGRTRSGTSEAVAYLNRFLEEPPRADLAYDPFRRAARVDEAKRILAEYEIAPRRK